MVPWCGYVPWLLHDLMVNMVYTQLTVGSVHLRTHTQDLIMLDPIKISTVVMTYLVPSITRKVMVHDSLVPRPPPSPARGLGTRLGA